LTLHGCQHALLFAGNAFALIVSPSTLDYFPDPRSLREPARVLEPGGRFIILLDNSGVVH
jgi:ubiquinone/menaquinone biosynthesis C-methylase UbiE